MRGQRTLLVWGGITPLFGLMRTRTLFGLGYPRAPLRVGLDHGLGRLSRGIAAAISAGASAGAWIGNLPLSYCGLTIGGQGAALLPGGARCNAPPDAAASLDGRRVAPGGAGCNAPPPCC